jgi:dihydrodipicolinate synthase/N-acetylneuraminate lyase
MKTSPVTPDDLKRSVIAVPPLARNADLSLNRSANAALIRHLEDGGVSSLMYGGNANFYHLPVSEYEEVVDMLADLAGANTWVLPSVGPDYGKMMDQAAILSRKRFPAAMLLPVGSPYTSDGLAAGVRRFTDALGKPAILYIKSNNYIEPDTLAKLVAEGHIVAVKYAVVLEHPETDPYLQSLLRVIDPARLVSGIGERPAIVHMRDFGISSMTSGSVCIAPRGSMELLRLLGLKRYAEAQTVRAHYMPLEDWRDQINPIRVLHDAVTLAGIADMGPMLPLMTGLDESDKGRVGAAARTLWETDRALAAA